VDAKDSSREKEFGVVILSNLAAKLSGFYRAFTQDLRHRFFAIRQLGGETREPQGNIANR
jgi:hypothetical protein